MYNKAILKSFAIFILIFAFQPLMTAQTKFQEGYYLTKDGKKVKGLIKNMDWRYAPTDFSFKSSSSASTSTMGLNDVLEFGINNASKYISAKVDVDQSSEEVDKLSEVRTAEFEEAEVFLKLLVEGEANLYLYKTDNLTRFFFKNGNGEIEPLIYKSYKRADGNISKNTRYKQQLSNGLKCEGLLASDNTKLEYKSKALVRLFADFNTCKGATFVDYNVFQKRDKFNLSLKGSLRNSSLSVSNESSPSRTLDYPSKTGFGLGLEAEFILGFYNNAWTILLEPTYQSYSATGNSLLLAGSPAERILISEVDYTSLEFPIGIRHYFFLNDDSKVFVNAHYVFDFDFGGKVSYSENFDDLEIGPRTNFAFGAGFMFKQFSIEARYQLPRGLFGQTLAFQSDYTTASVLVGYRLF